MAGPREAVGGLDNTTIKQGGMYIVYVLQSQKTQRHYIGQTNNLEDRLKRHNGGKVKSTKAGKPWKLIYSEEYKDRQTAYKRERKIKRYKGGEMFKKLLAKSK